MNDELSRASLTFRVHRSAFIVFLSLTQVASGHLRWLVHVEQSEDGRCDIFERRASAKLDSGKCCSLLELSSPLIETCQ